MTMIPNLKIDPRRLWDTLMETAKFGGTAKGGDDGEKGGGGGDSVTFNDSGASTYGNNFNIALSNSTDGPITFNGTTTFSGNNTLTASAPSINFFSSSGLFPVRISPAQARNSTI